MLATTIVERVPGNGSGTKSKKENPTPMTSTVALATSPSTLCSHGPPAARIVGGTKIYETEAGNVVALDQMNLEFADGRFTAIMGPSGSGKSTLMHCMAGLDRLTSGRVFIGDMDLAAQTDRDLTLLRRTRVGFVFQSFNLLPALTAEENILLPHTIAGVRPNPHAVQELVEVLALADRLHHRPSELSGGQQQRVAVARALITRPEIVFCDEPTGNLDTATGTEILGFLRHAVDSRGQTTVIVTHDPVAAAWADRVVFLVDGQAHHEIHQPTAADVLDVVKGLGR